jgi:RNA polymerase sigma factor (TIGR02999 family)
MSSPAPSEETTRLLVELREGDRSALDRLVPRLYDELHRIAHRELARRGGGVLRTTGLVHEAYLKLVDGKQVDAEDRAHFLALAATAMRHIVVDQARRLHARKRGGGLRRVPLDDDVASSDEHLEEIIEIDDALKRLEHLDDRLRTVVECRVFAGMTVAETAAAMGTSPRSVDRTWRRAKAWLHREIHEA